MDTSTKLRSHKRSNSRPSPLVISVTALLAFALMYSLAACNNSEPQPVQPVESQSQLSGIVFDEMPLTAAQPLASSAQLSTIMLQNIGDPTPELVQLEPLGRGEFPHLIDAMFKFKYGNRMEIVKIDNVSDVIAAKLTIQEGGSVGWHRHPGIAIGIIVSGTFGVIEETDCVLRTYNAGQAFFHRGQGILDVGFNAGDGDVVVYITFMGVPSGQPPTMPPGPGESPCPL